VYALRYQGYCDALYDHNIPFEENLLLVNDISENAGVEAARQIVKMKPLP
jgi:LacI family transcriptional regulator